jgi:hypothetical protein
LSTTVPCCDFCGADSSTWVMSCADLTLLASGPYGEARGTSLGAWCACNACLPFIQRGDADGLANHVARSANGPTLLIKLTTLRFRRNTFQRLYRRLLPQLEPARPLTRETAAAWQEAYRRWKPGDEASSRAVAATLERTG